MVVIRFMNRNYTGVVDFFLDEEAVLKRVESPTPGSPSSPNEGQAGPAHQCVSGMPTSVSAVTSANVDAIDTTTHAAIYKMILLSSIVPYGEKSLSDIEATPTNSHTRLIEKCVFGVVPLPMVQMFLQVVGSFNHILNV